MSGVPLQKLLATLNKSGLTLLDDFPAKLGQRQVRVVELFRTYAMIQPVDDPRSWEIAPIEQIAVDPDDVYTQTSA